jgi:hypothetical protein
MLRKDISKDNRELLAFMQDHCNDSVVSRAVVEGGEPVCGDDYFGAVDLESDGLVNNDESVGDSFASENDYVEHALPGLNEVFQAGSRIKPLVAGLLKLELFL